jgi:hypothetical protein
MAIDENVKNKVSISRYLGTYNDILKENSMSVLASYGNNKSHVLSKAKRLAKKASKNTVIQWQVFVNDTLKQMISKGYYKYGKLSDTLEENNNNSNN